MKKRITSIFLTLVMAFSLCAFASAAEPETAEVEGTYENGYVTITGELPAGDYAMIRILEDDSHNNKLMGAHEKVTVSADKPLEVEINTGKLEKENDRYRILVNRPDGSLAAEGYVVFDSETYQISITAPRNGSVTTNPAGSAEKGDTVTITATPNGNYKVDTVTVTDNGSKQISVTNIGSNRYTFAMPASNVTVTVTFTSTGGGGGGGGGGGNGGSSSSSGYSVSIPSSTANGTVKVSPTSASEGGQVTITATPDSGYEVGTVTVTDKDGKQISVTSIGNNRYTFTMPNSKVDVKVNFVRQQAIRFNDVQPGTFYYDAVSWAVENGITAGTSADKFTPDASCTRAQMVTFLWRTAGSPAPQGSASPFEDVAPGAFYYDAVLWAVENGITAGTSATTFSPDDTVTRGQTVAFLYRAAGSPAVSGNNTFADVASDAYYAAAVQWAADKGVAAGTSATTFSPNDDCTRAQIVTFLYRNRAN